MLLFITDNTCCMLFHIPVAKIIFCHGVSQELPKLLNRHGASAALETAKRLSTCIIHQKICRGVVPELDISALTMVTVDNINILETYALVSTLETYALVFTLETYRWGLLSYSI